MKNLGVIIAISIIISLLCVTVIAESQPQLVISKLWTLNTDTVVLNNSEWNVNLGQNESTVYKFKVNGFNGDSYIDSEFNRSLLSLRGGNDDNELLLFTSSNDFYQAVLSMQYGITGKLIIDEISNVPNLDINMYTTINDGLSVMEDTIFNKSVKINNNLNVSNNVSAYSYLGYGIIPLGGVISWCNHIGTVVLSIPDGFWICNGSTIVDSDSIFNGQPSPNMTNRFIRGVNYSQTNIISTGYMSGNNSHTMSLLELVAHTHTYTIPNAVSAVNHGPVGNLVNQVPSRTAGSSTSQTGSGNSWDSQPKYYDMVFLVRIK